MGPGFWGADMKATVDRLAFVAALARAKGIAGGKGMPALANVRLMTFGDSLEVASTDLQITYQGSIPATDTEPGVRLVNAALFYDVIRAMPGELVTVALVDERLLVTSASSVVMRINSTEDRAYPDLVDPSTFTMWDVDGAVLAAALRQVLPVVSRDESRPGLCAVNITAAGDASLLTASDGRRLHQAAGPGWALPAVQVPLRAAGVVREFLDGPVKLGVDGEKPPSLMVVRNAAGDTMTVRLGDAAFPDVSPILKARPGHVATFSAAEMGAAVRRTCMLAEGETRTLSLAFDGNQLAGGLVLTSGETDRAREVVAVAGRHPEAVIRINAKMLSEALAAAGEGASLLFGEVLTPVHVVAPGFQAVIMPQRG